jgi:hypothetical protein
VAASRETARLGHRLPLSGLGYNHPFELHWRVGPNEDDEVITEVVAGSIASLYFTEVSWGGEPLGYFVWHEEIDHLLKLRPEGDKWFEEHPFNYPTVKSTPPDQPEPTPPWGTWQKMENIFRVPATAWTGADPRYLLHRES